MRTLLVCSLLLVAAACADKPTPPKKSGQPPASASKRKVAKAIRLDDGARVEIGNAGETCKRTLCVAGPGELDDPANRDLSELCRRAPGVVRRCEGDRCMSVWTLEQWQQGLDGLIVSLDRNGDGQLDERESSCRINLAGWSKGAVVAAEELPESLRADPRVRGDAAIIQHLVAIVPWAPDHEQIRVADNVRKAWIYRHTQAPDDDCSKQFEGGPWLSPPPVCGPETRCWDYDYSYEPELAFVGRRGARSGREVGHCDIVALVAKIGLDNLAAGVEAPSEHLPRLASGEASGRESGPLRPPPPKLLANPPEPD